ncbi:MAG: MBOAT family protein [Myxococcaceae bacterium]|nr:MBOAT family protein [Myxococcaceae bacterium]
MLFPTIDYALFFLVAFAVAWGLRGLHQARKGFLLLASWVFYGFADWRFVPLLVLVSLLGGVVAMALERTTRPGLRKALVAFAVAANLLLLLVFKYLSFAAASLLSGLEAFGLSPGPVHLPELALPVGVSFFAFHAISLVVDAYRRTIPVPVRLLDALLYVAFFPQLVAGPILRASSFLPQLAAPARAPLDVPRALELLAVGLVKKVLVAQVLGTHLVDLVFEAPGAHAPLEVLLGIYGYAAQIYCDFSGYSDLATGSALLLGYEFPLNFDAPYRAQSPQQFWRKWHISLSSWLRDYLFIPLGGSRRGSTSVNLLITMVLGGLWHGAGLTFLLWGLLHGVGLVVHRAWAQAGGAVARLRKTRGWAVAAVVLTFHFVCLGWVFFRAPTFPAALDVLAALVHPGPAHSLPPVLALLVLGALLGPLVPASARERWRSGFSRWPLVAQGAAAALVVWLVDALGPRGIAPFIYFRF